MAMIKIVTDFWVLGLADLFGLIMTYFVSQIQVAINEIAGCDTTS